MAANPEHGVDTGSMSPSDMNEHVRTWNGFLTFMKWQIIGAVIVLIILAIFRTHG